MTRPLMQDVQVAVLGAGGWGTALALILAENPHHRVRLWAARPGTAAEMLVRRENIRFLPGIAIPEHVELTVDIDRAVQGANLLLEAIPTIYLRETFARIAERLPARVPLISV